MIRCNKDKGLGGDRTVFNGETLQCAPKFRYLGVCGYWCAGVQGGRGEPVSGKGSEGLQGLQRDQFVEVKVGAFAFILLHLLF